MNLLSQYVMYLSGAYHLDSIGCTVKGIRSDAAGEKTTFDNMLSIPPRTNSPFDTAGQLRRPPLRRRVTNTASAVAAVVAAQAAADRNGEAELEVREESIPLRFDRSTVVAAAASVAVDADAVLRRLGGDGDVVDFDANENASASVVSAALPSSCCIPPLLLSLPRAHLPPAIQGTNSS